MTGPLLLVDAASLYFRAYFGVPAAAATAPDGTPVNAVRGFLDMLATLIRTRRPERMLCALDADWRPAWRVALLPSYKAHRLTDDGAAGGAGGDGAAGGHGEDAPADLNTQVPIILDALAAIGIAAVGVPGFEADDVIGTLAARDAGPVEVATGDRDLFQVIDDDRGVRVLYCGRGVSKLEVFDDAAVATRYGVPAGRYADLAALRGDPSDGLPGVPGVGAKTAARLVGRYQGVDGILAAIDDPSAGFAPGLRTRLVTAREYLAAALEVTAVRRDVPVPALDLALPGAPADTPALTALAERWNLAGPVRRLLAALGEAVPAAGPPA